jgi:ubiquitin-protein ligase
MSSLFSKRVVYEKKFLEKHPMEHIHAFSTDNEYTWYFLIRGAKNSILENGRYLGKMILPYSYPASPPDCWLFTPNGLINEGQKLYFANIHTPVLTIQGYIANIHAMMEESVIVGKSSAIYRHNTKLKADNSHGYNMANYKELYTHNEFSHLIENGEDDIPEVVKDIDIDI